MDLGVTLVKKTRKNITKAPIPIKVSSKTLQMRFIVLMMLFINEPQDLKVTAMFVSDRPLCSDSTPLGECSAKSLGNICEMSRNGPALVYSATCYE